MIKRWIMSADERDIIPILSGPYKIWSVRLNIFSVIALLLCAAVFLLRVTIMEVAEPALISLGDQQLLEPLLIMVT